ncbi:mRNA turnover protein 4 homolog [Rhipicephalus sanguineus]|uniref:mRNA turnover protein 4 homolog n=1 Tax=Rhipicephalus sanguineus TaxID=34632 RepID=UPI0018955927|nr:mRNA turnover protein 4 homolog [Rhipicephalus sanguineus]
MPRSKRNRQVSLTRTKKKGLEHKRDLIQEVRDAFEKYDKVFVYSVSNMRNSKLKDVRQEWKDSRFYFGKNKVMSVALGRFIDEDHRENLHKVSERLRGQCGLFFTNAPKEKVLQWFNEYSDPDYARAGFRATQQVFLDQGPLPQFQHSLEPHLRRLGLPTSLQKGVVTLVKDHEVCKEGEVLKPEQASILKLLGIKMATFKITMEFLWNSDGTCEVLCESTNEFGKKNKSVRGKKRQKLAAEDDEGEEDDDADNGSEEEEEELDSAGEESDESDVSLNGAEDAVKQRPKKVAVRSKRKK